MRSAVMQGWEIALYAVAGFIAVMTLVKMMRVRRDVLIRGVREDFNQEQQRKAEEERRQRVADRASKDEAA